MSGFLFINSFLKRLERKEKLLIITIGERFDIYKTLYMPSFQVLLTATYYARRDCKINQRD